MSVDSGMTASYVYNAEGQRVEKNTSSGYIEYLFDSDGNPIGENNRTSWTDTWVPFNGRHIAHFEGASTTLFIHADQIGTTNIVTDHATGNIVQDELHYPWGQEWTMAGSMEEERFAGMHHRDSETTLDPTQNRMYSSASGRWQSPDPVRSCPYHPENFDRYSYAANNPTNRTDPGGNAVYGGIDYPYDDYGYDFYGFLPNPEPYGPFGFVGPGGIPNGGWISCAICRAAARGRYYAAVSDCSAGYLSRALLGGPAGAGLGYFQYRSCIALAEERYAQEMSACAYGPCSPDSDNPYIPF